MTDPYLAAAQAAAQRMYRGARLEDGPAWEQLTASDRRAVHAITDPAVDAALRAATTTSDERITLAARRYVAIRQRHRDAGPLLSQRKAAHEALIAAVEAAGIDFGDQCRCGYAPEHCHCPGEAQDALIGGAA